MDPRHGWLGGSVRDDTGLFRTADGGRTWPRVSAPLPACCRNWTALFDAPTFLDDEQAVVPVTLRDGDRSVVALDVTSDGGQTWRVAAVLPPVSAGASGFPSPASVSIATTSDWWVLAGSPPVLRRTDDGGQTWRSIAIPKARRAISIDAVDGRRAWITVLDGRLATLLATRNGGRTWRRLTPFARPNRPAASTALRTILPLPGPVTAVTQGENGVVYASYLPDLNADRQVLVRFDPATGAVQRSLPIPGGQGGVDRLAESGGSLWASTGSPSARPGRILYRLNSRTLEVRERIRMPGPTGPLAAVPAGLWVAAGRRVVLIDPETGETIRSVAFQGRTELMVADPSGRWVYVSTNVPSGRVRHPCSSLTRQPARSSPEAGRAAQTSTARVGCPPPPTASG